MLTVAELKSIPLFAALGESEFAELGRSAADLHLGDGEYAAHEGDEAALLVVLEGGFDVTKLVDGIERKLGARGVGQIHGEVTLIFGTRFQSAARAAGPTRALRVDAASYYRVAAAAPAFAQRIDALARDRITGLQSLAAEARPVAVTLVGSRADPATQELRRFFDRNQTRYDWIAPDAPDLAARWRGAPLLGAFPAVHCEDGTTLFRPTPREIAERLGLPTRPKFAAYDTVVIGGGPAGLAAAVYGASEGLRIVVIEREAPGGQAGTSSRIENYLGFPSGISGAELADRAYRQAIRLGAEILRTRRIKAIDPERREITLDGGEALQARTTILATGVSWRRVPIEGFDRLIGKGVYYGTARSDAGIAQGLDVHLIGAGNSAGQAAIYLANHAASVTLVVRGDALEKSMSQYLVDQIRGKSNIHVALRSEVQAVHGDEALAAVDIVDRATGEVRRRDSGGVFVFIGADAETDWLPGAVARDRRGYVLTGSDLIREGRWSLDRDPYLLETSAPGMFACGDVRLSPVKRVASAVGEGSMAIAFVHQFLATETTPAKVG